MRALFVGIVIVAAAPARGGAPIATEPSAPPERVARIAQGLASPRWVQREAAHRELRQLASELLPVVEELANSPDPNVRGPALEVIAARIKSNDAQERRQAIELLRAVIRARAGRSVAVANLLEQSLLEIERHLLAEIESLAIASGLT